MKILISACLLGVNCKYDGGNNNDEGLRHLLQGHELHTVCPEILGGLDPSVEEDRPEIISRDLFHRTCTDAVCFSIRRVSEMLEEKQET